MAVSGDGRAGSVVHGDVEPRVETGTANHAERGVDHRCNIDRLDRHGQPTRLDPADVEHVFDQRKEMQAAFMDLAKRSPVGLGPAVVEHEEFGEAEHGVQGRAELVTHA